MNVDKILSIPYYGVESASKETDYDERQYLASARSRGIVGRPPRARFGF